jgi:hypothetical protein
MKHMNQKPAVAATPTTTSSTGTPSLAAPTLGGPGETASATPAAGSLTSGDVPPPAQDGQLASFSRFASKDPFAQQLSDEMGGATSSGSSSGGGSSGGTPSSGGGSSSSGGLQQPGPGSAVISLNGTLMTVPVGSDFPQATTTDPNAQPLFHLISVTSHTARISIVGGSYSNGARSVTLRENKPLTLMNTADGVRYKLILKPQGTPVPSESGGTSTSPTTTVTLPAATP